MSGAVEFICMGLQGLESHFLFEYFVGFLWFAKPSQVCQIFDFEGFPTLALWWLEQGGEKSDVPKTKNLLFFFVIRKSLKLTTYP